MRIEELEAQARCRECDQLRKRRDGLLAANNRLVEERRSMAQDRDRMALRCEQLFRGYNSAYGQLSQLRVDLRELIRQHGGQECPLGDEVKALGLLLDSVVPTVTAEAHEKRIRAKVLEEVRDAIQEAINWWEAGPNNHYNGGAINALTVRMEFIEEQLATLEAEQREEEEG